MSDRKGRADGSVTPAEFEDMLARLFRNGRTNAIVAWGMFAVLVGVFAESVLDVDYQWIGFVAAVGAIVLLPPVVYRDWRVMLPWELLLLALLPILVRGLFGGEVGTYAYYLSIAAVALLITVEFHMFTELTVTHWFAVLLVVVTTLASVAAWSIARWLFDLSLGTAYLTTNEALMIEFLWVTLAGLSAGVIFDTYFRRRDRQLRRAIGRVIGR